MDSRVTRCNYLIKKIQKGDTKALDDLFVEFGPLFLSIAKIYLYDKSYADDLLSEVFLDLLKRGARSFNGEKNGLNWFFVVIKRKAYQYNVKYSKYFAASDELEGQKSLVNFIDTSNDFDKSLDKIIVSDSLKKLDEYENTLLYYKYWECLTVRQIAKKLNKPKSTVQYEIKQVLERLKKLLDEGQA